MSTSGISYRVYEYQRVKHQVSFFSQRVYPVYIMIIHDRRSLNFKSHLFAHLLRQKYQVSMQINDCAVSIQDVIAHEQGLLSAIICNAGEDITLEACRQAYAHASADWTQVMDLQCKETMTAFFSREALPAIALSIRNMAEVLTADLILDDLRISLTREVREKLFGHLQPCIHLFRFCNRKQPGLIPLLTPFLVNDGRFIAELSRFLGNNEDVTACMEYLTSLENKTVDEIIGRIDL